MLVFMSQAWLRFDALDQCKELEVASGHRTKHTPDSLC